MASEYNLASAVFDPFGSVYGDVSGGELGGGGAGAIGSGDVAGMAAAPPPAAADVAVAGVKRKRVATARALESAASERALDDAANETEGRPSGRRRAGGKAGGPAAAAVMAAGGPGAGLPMAPGAAIGPPGWTYYDGQPGVVMLDPSAITGAEGGDGGVGGDAGSGGDGGAGVAAAAPPAKRGRPRKAAKDVAHSRDEVDSAATTLAMMGGAAADGGAGMASGDVGASGGGGGSAIGSGADPMTWTVPGIGTAGFIMPHGLVPAGALDATGNMVTLDPRMAQPWLQYPGMPVMAADMTGGSSGVMLDPSASLMMGMGAMPAVPTAGIGAAVAMPGAKKLRKNNKWQVTGVRFDPRKKSRPWEVCWGAALCPCAPCASCPPAPALRDGTHYAG